MSGGGETARAALEAADEALAAAGYQLMSLTHPNGICCDKDRQCVTCETCTLIDEALARLREPERAAESTYRGIAGHCFDIDGDRWHEPGKCSNCNPPGQSCCWYETQPAQPESEQPDAAQCLCERGHPESYEGPARECPIHGQPDAAQAERFCTTYGCENRPGNLAHAFRPGCREYVPGQPGAAQAELAVVTCPDCDGLGVRKPAKQPARVLAEPEFIPCKHGHIMCTECYPGGCAHCHHARSAHPFNQSCQYDPGRCHCAGFSEPQPEHSALAAQAEPELDVPEADEAQAEPACTGVSAGWCPRCGDCTCPRDDEGCRVHDELTGDVDETGCPLHDPSSPHAEEPEPEHSALAALRACVEALEEAVQSLEEHQCTYDGGRIQTCKVAIAKGYAALQHAGRVLKP